MGDKVYQEDEELPYLTPLQKRFCRLYLKLGGKSKKAHNEAARQLFPDQNQTTDTQVKVSLYTIDMFN